jgi:crossover junction endodeoxyribonuclease RusA
VTVEIQFPVEFVVQGTPVSLQAKRRESIREWQATVKRASRSVLPEGHFTAQGPIAVTLYYFPDALMQGDIDNIVKPILDALKRLIYVSDHQVERVLVQKFEPEHVFGF